MAAITTATAFGILGVVVLWFLPSVLVYRVAERKGRPGWVYLVAALLVGWPVPLLVALVVRSQRGAA